MILRPPDRRRESSTRIVTLETRARTVAVVVVEHRVMRYVTRDAIAVDRDDASRGGVARRECARGRRVRARHSRAEPFDRALEFRGCARERAGARGGGVAREGWYAGTLRAGAYARRWRG